MTEAASIKAIDAAIDANHAELVTRLADHRPRTAWGWQNAWNLHPDLDARERDLFRVKQRIIARAEGRS